MKIFETLPDGFNLVQDEIGYKLATLTFAQAFGDYHYPIPSIDIGTRGYTKVHYETCKVFVNNALKHDGCVLSNEDFSAVICVSRWVNRGEPPVDKIVDFMHGYADETAIKNYVDICNYIGEEETFLHFDDDAYYIECFAVQPPLQGQKIGSKLMRKLFEEADIYQKDIILFTNTDKNRDIYLHFGFEIAREAKRTDLNSVTYFMVRHPNK